MRESEWNWDFIKFFFGSLFIYLTISCGFLGFQAWSQSKEKAKAKVKAGEYEDWSVSDMKWWLEYNTLKYNLRHIKWKLKNFHKINKCKNNTCKSYVE